MTFRSCFSQSIKGGEERVGEGGKGEDSQLACGRRLSCGRYGSSHSLVSAECSPARGTEVEDVEARIGAEGNAAETPGDEGKEEPEEETTSDDEPSESAGRSLDVRHHVRLAMGAVHLDGIHSIHIGASRDEHWDRRRPAESRGCIGCSSRGSGCSCDRCSSSRDGDGGWRGRVVGGRGIVGRRRTATLFWIRHDSP
ncbi:hypothetical protein PENTCL1PPCAC_23554, partial [Pristionchus entomophagus]